MRRYIFLIISIFLLGISCKKEYSYEGGAAPLVASGSLTDSLGNCSNISVSGSYKPNIIFTDNNYITVKANIATAGSYTIYTDTVNGYYFAASGFVGGSGLQPVKLKAYGKSLQATTSQFTVHFNDDVCRFSILPDSAAFNFAANCGAAVVNGVYKTNVLLDGSDTVNILVNVTSPGPYNIEMPIINGIKFTSKGTFTSLGNYLITLAGSGTPVTEGNTIIPITIGGNSCSFIIPVISNVITYPLFWRYTVDSTIHKQGILDSGRLSTSFNFLYPANEVHDMQVYGANGPLLSPVTFQLNIARINQALSIGLYNPGITGSKDFIGYVGHFDITGNLSASNTLPSFTITVTNYDAATRLVEGTFSGPVIDDFGRQHTLTDGAFRTYFKK